MKKAYHGGGGIYNVIGNDFANIERNKDAANADGLDAWFDPSPKAVEKLNQNLIFSIKTSPPLHGEGLIEMISSSRSIPKGNIVVSGGSSDLMFTLFPNLGIRKVLILDPMYGEYKHIFQNVLSGIEIHSYTLSSENDFSIDPSEFSDKIKEVTPDAVVIVNPNSPAGKFLCKKEIETILSAIPSNVLFVIDETYVDYVDSKESAETLVSSHNNLIIIKSMSKVYSLSGARVGYAVLPQSLVEKIDKHIPPFSVSTAAQILGIEALKDIDYYKEKWEETRKLRAKLVNELSVISDIKVYSGEGNFVLVKLEGNNTGKAEEIVTKLAGMNIFIRNAESMSKNFGQNYLRIAVKDHETNSKIVSSLKSIL